MTDNKRATILLAHGSTDPNWLAPFDKLLNRINDGLDGEMVRLAYMELAEPSLKGQIIELHQEGATHIDILPLFFAAGRHLRKDVPAMLEALTPEVANTKLLLHPPIGLEPEVADAISQIVIRHVSDV